MKIDAGYETQPKFAKSTLVNRILQEFPRLEEFRKRFESFGTPFIKKLGVTDIHQNVWYDDGDYIFDANEVFLVYPDRTVEVEQAVWRSMEDHGIPDMMVSFMRRQDRNTDQCSCNVYVRPCLDMIRGEVEYLIRSEINRLRDIADGIISE